MGRASVCNPSTGSCYTEVIAGSGGDGRLVMARSELNIDVEYDSDPQRVKTSAAHPSRTTALSWMSPICATSSDAWPLTQ